MVSSLTGMFADTDPAYIRLRAEDLVGKHVAIERYVKYSPLECFQSRNLYITYILG